MPDGRVIQNSFNAGEISRLMEGRTDFPRYANSAYTLENWIIHTQGGVSRRWGTRFIANCAVNNTTRLVPFIVDGITWYVLEFGNYVIRVHRPTQAAPDNTTVDIVSPYSASEVFEIGYAQSADVMYLVHSDHAVQKLSRLDALGATWDIGSVSSTRLRRMKR